MHSFIFPQWWSKKMLRSCLACKNHNSSCFFLLLHNCEAIQDHHDVWSFKLHLRTLFFLFRMSYKKKVVQAIFAILCTYYTTNIKSLESQVYSYFNTFGKYLDQEKKSKSWVPLWKYSHLQHEIFPNSEEKKSLKIRRKEAELLNWVFFSQSFFMMTLPAYCCHSCRPIRQPNGILELHTLQTSFHLCIPKRDLAKPHFKYQLNISKTEL